MHAQRKGLPSLFVDANDLNWRPSPHEGVEWKKLRFDRRGSVVLLRFAPGASYGAHRHPEGEEYWVLEEGGRTHGPGSWIEHPPGSWIEHPPGSWIEHPPGSVHRPRSCEGCIVLVRLPAPIEPLAAASPEAASPDPASPSPPSP